MILEAQRVELRPGQVEKILTAVREGRRITVSGAPGQGRSSMVAAVAREIGPRGVRVQVPSGLDKVEVTVLSIAEQLGPRVLEDAAKLLHGSLGDPSRSLELIRKELAATNRKLLVDDVDSLTQRSPENELAAAYEPNQRRLWWWLRQHAALKTTRWRNRNSIPLERPEPGRIPFSLGHEWDPVTRGLWASVGENPGWFRVALSRTLVTGRNAPLSRTPLPQGDDRYFEETWAALPVVLQQALSLLAVHGRPLALSIFNQLSGEQGPLLSKEALRTLLAESDDRYIWLYSPWRPWILGQLPATEQQALHQSLGNAFAASVKQGGDPDRRALHVVEAHRHFLAVPDLAEARKLARYGVGLLLEHGRALSREERFTDSIKVYEAALEVIPALKGELLGRRARAYAVHYLHYNRFRANAELIPETEKGYQEAVNEWPEHALFWSRLAMCRFTMGDVERAFTTLDEAHARVPRHRAKAAVLVVRTVNRLLRSGRIQEALLVWGDYRPVGLEQLNELGLLSALKAGWETHCLRTRGQRVYFYRPLKVRVDRVDGTYVCEVPECAFSRQGLFPAEAVDNVITGLRTEALSLHRRLSHTLSEEERERKGRILGLVDLIQSGLLSPLRPTTRLLGRLESHKEGLRFQAFGTGAGSFALAGDLAPSNVEPHQLYYALVSNGAAGEPVGPVQALEPVVDRPADGLWREWEQVSIEES